MRVFYVLLDLADGRTLRLLTKQHTKAEARRYLVRWARYVLHVEVTAVLAAFPVEAVALLKFYEECAIDNVANLAGVR